VRTEVDAELRRDATRYGLRYACEDCAYFVAPTGGCAEGFPNAMHRARPLDVETTALVFCKRFELA
jgi:hypothetical protein